MIKIMKSIGISLIFYVSLFYGINSDKNDENLDELLMSTFSTFSDVPSETPQNVTLESSSSTSVIVRWEPPPKDMQNGIITGYRIKYKIKGSKKQDVVTTDGNRRLYELVNLEKGVTYSIKISALSANGSGPATDWMSIETFSNDLDETQVPDKPSTLRAKPNANALYVSWTPPKNQNILIRGYTIGWGVGFPDVYTKVLDGKQRSFTIENLQSSSEYVISLRAFNQVGDGQPIYETVKTLIESAHETHQPMLPPVGLKAIVLSSTTVVLYWTDSTLLRSQVANENRRYLVKYTSNVHSNNPKYKYLNTTDLNSMIDDLKPNTQYEFAVKVVKGRRESTWSMSVLNTTQEAQPSSPPRDLTVVPSNNDDPAIINLHWQPPKQPNGHITGYVIFYTTDNTQRDRDWVVEGVIGDKMTTVLKGLLPDSLYYFKIQARNNKGYGPLSAVVSFKTLVALPEPENRNIDGRNISTNTLYIIIGVITSISVLLLIVVGTLLVRTRNGGSGGYMGAIRKPKGYIAAAMSPSTKLGSNSVKVKGNNRELKPPDLWIHHSEQIELKDMDKSFANDTMTATPIKRTSQEINDDIIDKSKITYTYKDTINDIHSIKKPMLPIDTNITLSGTSTTSRKSARNKPIITSVDQTSLVNGSINMEPSTGLSRPLYPRTQFNIPRAHVSIDALDNSNSGVQHMHHLYDPVASPTVHMGLSSTIIDNTPLPLNSSHSSNPASHSSNPASHSSHAISSSSLAINSNVGKRQTSHPLKSFCVPSPPLSLQNTQTTPFSQNVRTSLNTSPNKKIIAGNSVLSGNNCAFHPQKIIPSTRGPDSIKCKEHASSSTEELNQEMANLEGLMKDLNAITANEFKC